jgi:hypothetical protein
MHTFYPASQGFPDDAACALTPVALLAVPPAEESTAGEPGCKRSEIRIAQTNGVADGMKFPNHRSSQAALRFLAVRKEGYPFR